ncbi:gag protein [Colletotrichum incanum]|uniref:Gag protein n=1 Tax=Colletotrichum incanum TaxID=1573173 RepID=A0A166XWD1_COLIC|nr:gag protein [Colletotrichum incanum]
MRNDRPNETSLGLKEEVKDKLVKIITPLKEFLDYVELVIRINTRLYERRKEKGENRRPQANSAKKYIPQGPKTTQFNNRRNY